MNHERRATGAAGKELSRLCGLGHIRSFDVFGALGYKPLGCEYHPLRDESGGAMAKTMRHVTEQDLEQLSSLFGVLSDKTRLQILLTLVDGEKNVGSICDSLKLPQPTVSHHLALLRMNNVVGHRRDGKQVYYSLDGRVHVDSALDMILSVQNLVVRIGSRHKQAGRKSAGSRK